MSDQIKISGIKGFGFHGVLDFEKKDGQDFLVDLVINLDLKNLNDALENTVDYGEVATLVKSEIENNPVNLIETLAERIAEKILSTYRKVNSVEVTVHKPNAPLPVDFSDLSVTIKKSK